MGVSARRIAAIFASAQTSKPLRFASGENFFSSRMDAGQNGGAAKRTQSLSVTTHFLGDDHTDLCVSVNADCLDGSFVAGNGYTILGCYLERMDGVSESKQLLFGGSPTRVVAAGELDVRSDPIYPTAFTSLSQFSKNASFTTRVNILLASQTDQLPVTNDGGQALKCNPDTTVLPPVSGTGSIGYIVSGGDWDFTAPATVLLLGHKASGDALTPIMVGDSITIGYQGSIGGYGRKALTNGSNHLSGCFSGSIGYGPEVWANDMATTGGKRLHFMRYANAMVENFGINNSGGFPANTASTQAQLKSIWALARAAGYTKIIRPGFTPRTDGDFTVESGQTYAANCGPGGFQDTYATWFQSQVGLSDGISHYVNLRTQLGGTDMNKWPPGGSGQALTPDGLHPNDDGQTAIAPALRTLYASL